jgi:hypothetical protein
VGGKVEGKKEDDEATTKEQDSNDYIIVSIRDMSRGCSLKTYRQTR